MKAAHVAVVSVSCRKSGSPVFVGPRIPDFLSRVVALNKFVRLSLRESHIRGRG
jgi:hypothetical protein